MRISDWSSDVCSSDLIKIDRSFVSSSNQNSDSAAIVSAIARLGDSLGLPIPAEGIEDKDIERRLRRLGCTKGAGWHFGKPSSVDQTATLLAERNLPPTRVTDTDQPGKGDFFNF